MSIGIARESHRTKGMLTEEANLAVDWDEGNCWNGRLHKRMQDAILEEFNFDSESEYIERIN
jgi:hypothetical protein